MKKIEYSRLNARQQENFNIQKLSAVLADYGFVTFRLSDDWGGADLIALHISGEVLRVQLKSRLTFDRKYEGKGLYVAFADAGAWYLYPHDELLATILAGSTVGLTRSWNESSFYHYPRMSRQLRGVLERYRITGDAKPISG